MKYMNNKNTTRGFRNFRESKDYDAYFNAELEKTGKSIDDMTDAEKKEFFNKIDRGWKAKNESLLNNRIKKGLMESLKPGDILIHKHYPQYSIELIEPTNKGWKVYEMEKTKSKVKKKIAYYYSGDVIGDRALFEPVNDINSNGIRENKTNNNNMKNRIRQIVREELNRFRSNRTLHEEKGKYVIHIDSPRELRSKSVYSKIKNFASSGVRSRDIKLSMGFVASDPSVVLGEFQKLKNKIYFELDF